MLTKPVIEILTGSLVSGNNPGQLEVSRSPRGRADQSPRGIKKSFDFGAVGLGIVAALEKSDGITANSALFSRNLSRSKPIPARDPKIGIDGGRKGDDRSPFRIQSGNRGSVFHISPPRFAGEGNGFPAPDFLSFCDLCHKKLHGKDIYMYRGEKAFCSTECRYRQMVVDERTDKCSSEASRPPAEVAVGSPYANGQIFAAGILAI